MFRCRFLRELDVGFGLRTIRAHSEFESSLFNMKRSFLAVVKSAE
jgi:hypothetical protein